MYFRDHNGTRPKVWFARRLLSSMEDDILGKLSKLEQMDVCIFHILGVPHQLWSTHGNAHIGRQLPTTPRVYGTF